MPEAVAAAQEQGGILVESPEPPCDKQEARY